MNRSGLPDGVSGERLLEVVRLIPDVLFACHKESDGKIYWSLNEGGLAEQFGLTTDAIRGKSLDELFPGGASSELHKHFEDAFRGEITVFTNEIEGRHFRHFPQPVYDEDGNVVEVVGFIADVTELVEAELRLTRVNEELDAFVHAVSHELRNPITALTTWSRVIRAADDPDKIKATVARMESTVERMRTLVEGLLELSRAGHAALKWDAVDVRRLAAEVWRDVGRDDATMAFEGEELLQADPAFARIVLENLLSNAVKYRAEDRPLAVSVAVKDGNLQVHDNGRGFSESPESLFAVFARGAEATRSGYGVGLSTVRRIVERHGGAIEAKSVPGQGSTFTLNFGSPAR